MILGLTSGTFMFFSYQMCQGLTRFAARAAAPSKPFRKHARVIPVRGSQPNACLALCRRVPSTAPTWWVPA